MISKNGNTVPSSNDMNAIAANVIEWSRKQAEAFDQRPLTYIECLLEQMGKADYVLLGDIGAELSALVPWIKPEVSDALVSVYMDRRQVEEPEVIEFMDNLKPGKRQPLR